MKKVIAVLNATGLVGTLNEAATEELVANGVQAITGALSAKDQEIATLKKKIGDMETASITEKQNALKVNATALAQGALTAGKIVAAQLDAYIGLASASQEGYESVKKIFDGTQAYKPVNQQLSAAADNELPKNLDKQKELFDKHIKEGTMSTLSAESVKTLWKAKHGKEISEATLKALSAQ